MKKLLAIISCVLLLLGIFASCGKSKNAVPELYDYAAGTADGNSAEFMIEDSEAISEESKVMAESGSVELDEKLVKTVSMSIETKEFTACMDSLKAAATANGGYIENSDVNSSGYYNYNGTRNASVTFRIPADKLDAFLKGTEEKDKVVSKSENVENVTLEYVDVESRIKACKTERESLLELLKKAENVTDIISIRERLTTVNYEIENYSAQLRVLENRVSYSTVTVNIDEVQRVTEEENSLGAEIKNRFLESWDSLVEFFRSFVVWLIGGIPVLLPLAIVIVIAIIIIKKKIKKCRAKKHKENQ